ncbi:unnamed protein product [Linum tenue]|uniref:Uncharacterized protein n=1 Tax=Linum tenue TaxID=586396 RepID=A0AAV0Q6C9_9ROSI|nr:unnamed protein product [Linum tenue]
MSNQPSAACPHPHPFPILSDRRRTANISPQSTPLELQQLAAQLPLASVQQFPAPDQPTTASPPTPTSKALLLLGLPVSLPPNYGANSSLRGETAHFSELPVWESPGCDPIRVWHLLYISFFCSPLVGNGGSIFS